MELAFFRTKPTLNSDKAVSGGTCPCNPWTKQRKRISEILISESSGDMCECASVPLAYSLPPPHTVRGEKTLRMDFSLIIFYLELPNARCYFPVHTAVTPVTSQLVDLLWHSHHICHLPQHQKALQVGFNVQMLVSQFFRNTRHLYLYISLTCFSS